MYDVPYYLIAKVYLVCHVDQLISHSNRLAAACRERISACVHE